MEEGEEEYDETFQDYVTDQPVRLRDKSPIQSRLQNGEPTGRAPTMTIKAVRVGRPIKVLSFLSIFVALLLFFISTSSTAWMKTRRTRMGLFQECVNSINDSNDNLDLELKNGEKAEGEGGEGEGTPRNEGELGPNECGMSECISAIIKIFGGLNLFTILLTTTALILMAYAMLTYNIVRKSLTYNIVVGLNCVAMATALASLVAFPVYFWLKFNDTEVRSGGHLHGGGVTFGWSLYVGCAGVFMLALATGLLVFDKSGEEVVFREKIIRNIEEGEGKD